MSSLSPARLLLRLVTCIGVTWMGVMLLGLIGYPLKRKKEMRDAPGSV